MLHEFSSFAPSITITQGRDLEIFELVIISLFFARLVIISLIEYYTVHYDLNVFETFEFKTLAEE